jgi:transcriptional regulator with GAF, ATPase, and Fis domain
MHPEETARGSELAAALREARAGREQERLWRLVALAQALASHRRLDALVEEAAEAALAVTGAERAFVALAVPGGGATLEAARTASGELLREPERHASRSLIERTIATGEPLLAANAAADPGLSAIESVSRLRLRSVLCLPLRLNGRVAGAVYVDNRFRPGAFGEAERRFLDAVAAQTALALDAALALEEADRARARAEEQVASLRGTAETQALALARLSEAIAARSIAPPGEWSDIVGRSPAARRVIALLARVAASEGPVLITGESGTGKELAARAIHRNGRRRDGPFVPENFAAIADGVVESELFGHARGAFTGAAEERAGLFELAHGGTIFLDEIGDAPLGLQRKLLRVLEQGEVRRVGGDRPLAIDVRVIAATSRDLPALVRAGAFREDLYYRLNVLEVRLPPLRERIEDVPALVACFLARAAEAEGGRRRAISREALRALARRPWPGNVRELANAVRRLAALGRDPISASDVAELLDPPIAPAGGGGAVETLEAVERAHVERVLAACGHRPVEAARKLGIGYTTLWRKMKAYGLRARRRS